MLYFVCCFYSKKMLSKKRRKKKKSIRMLCVKDNLWLFSYIKAQDWKKFGNGDFLQVGDGFRRKSKLIVNNHICPFILTVQVVAAGRAVTNILIATRSAGWDFSVVILLISSAWPWVNRWRRAVTQWQAGCSAAVCGAEVWHLNSTWHSKEAVQFTLVYYHNKHDYS